MHLSRFILCNWIEIEDAWFLTLGAYLSPSDAFLLWSWIVPTCVFHLTTHFPAFPRLFAQSVPYIPWDKLSKTRQGNKDNIFCPCPWLDCQITVRRFVLAQLLPQQACVESDCKRIGTCCHWWMKPSSWDAKKNQRKRECATQHLFWSFSRRGKVYRMCLDKVMIHNLCNVLQLLGGDRVQPAWLLSSWPFLLFAFVTVSSCGQTWRKISQEYVWRDLEQLLRQMFVLFSTSQKQDLTATLLIPESSDNSESVGWKLLLM